jgi:hypothetical protein
MSELTYDIEQKSSGAACSIRAVIPWRSTAKGSGGWIHFLVEVALPRHHDLLVLLLR